MILGASRDPGVPRSCPAGSIGPPGRFSGRPAEFGHLHPSIIEKLRKIFDHFLGDSRYLHDGTAGWTESCRRLGAQSISITGRAWIVYRNLLFREIELAGCTVFGKWFENRSFSAIFLKGPIFGEFITGSYDLNLATPTTRLFDHFKKVDSTVFIILYI